MTTPRRRRSRVATIALALTAVITLATACSSSTDSVASQSSTSASVTGANGCPTMSDTPAWYGDNAARINTMLATYGHCAAHPNSAGSAPLALFDWDNTVVRNDIGNATFYWMVAHDKIRRPQAWSATSPFLTPDAQRALAAACDGSAAVGAPLPTSRTPACADELLKIYGDAETTTDKDAFAGYNHREMEPAYAWLAQLFAGWTPAEIGEFATAGRTEALAAKVGATTRIGTTEVDSWVRYYDQIKNLIVALRANGFDVRIISASPERVVQVWAHELGFTDDKIMGITSEIRDGRYTATLPGCGDRPANTIITYVDGKRCRINSQVLGISGAAALDEAPQPRRQVFAAGDSDTDMTFLSDATGLRLAINRNKTALMCRAYFDADDKWIVNPMFIDPEGADDEYKCSTEGDFNAAGDDLPLVINGTTVPTQQDRVHG